MTIVHVTAPGSFGGLERVVSGLAAGVSDRGRDVAVVTVFSDGRAMPQWLLELTDHRVHIELLSLSSRQYLREREVVGSLFTRLGASVIHTHGYRSDVLHSGVARALGLPVVSTAHGFTSLGFRGKAYEWLQKRAWRGFDAVVAVSHPLADALLAAGVSASRLETIPNGTVQPTSSPPSRDQARRALGVDGPSPVIGWVGRLSEEKDPHLAIDALRRLPDSSARLCFVGDGPLRASLQSRVSELGLTSRVVLAGSLPDARAAYAGFDVMLVTSRSEGTPMVVLEAAAALVPIVATSVGGIPDMVGSDALLVSSRGAEALAQAVSHSLANPEESRLRALRLLHRMTETTPGQDWISRYLAVYDRVRNYSRPIANPS